jgi:hypothetical protein
MQNILVRRYEKGFVDGVPMVGNFWQGWIEPEDGSWIAFIDIEGKPVFFLNRDPETGAVLDAPPGVNRTGERATGEPDPSP